MKNRMDYISMIKGELAAQGWNFTENASEIDVCAGKFSSIIPEAHITIHPGLATANRLQRINFQVNNLFKARYTKRVPMLNLCNRFNAENIWAQAVLFQYEQEPIYITLNCTSEVTKEDFAHSCVQDMKNCLRSLNNFISPAKKYCRGKSIFHQMSRSLTG